MLTFYEKLIKNWECGLFTMVKNNTNGNYGVFTFRNTDIGFSMSWWGREEESLNRLGYNGYYSKESIIEDSVVGKWEIVKTIHPSELMGKGYKTGDKVRIKKTGEFFTIHNISDFDANKLIVEENNNSYLQRDIEPCFEEKLEEMVNIDGKDFSKSTIKEALRKYIG